MALTVTTMKTYLAILIFMFVFTATGYGLESDYSKPWCASIGGQYQVSVKDAAGAVIAYIDCVTSTTAWEVDFPDKWYESVGQAHYYAALTGKRPGIAIIITDPSQQKYLTRLNMTAAYWGWHCLDITTIR